jgi:hypothetical protein
MTPASGISSGAIAVEARIAAIRTRIDGLVGPASAGPVPVFELAGGTTPSGPDAAAPPADAGGGGAIRPAGGQVQVLASDGPPPAAPVTGSPLLSRLPEHGRRWAGALEDAARAAGIEPSLLAALVRHESDFDPGVVSRAGAIGLAQLMPGTAAGLGVDPHDPHQNLRGGARYLRQQLDRFGSVELALAAYNAGPTRVAQAGGVPKIAETQAYVPRVLATWETYR